MDYDRQVRLMVECYGILLGSDDKLEAEFYFIVFCRSFARDNENRLDQLREYVHNKESATASPQHPISAAAASSSHLRPIDYITSPIVIKQHPIAAAAPSSSHLRPIDYIMSPIVITQHPIAAAAAPSSSHLKQIDYITSPIVIKQHPIAAAYQVP